MIEGIGEGGVFHLFYFPVPEGTTTGGNIKLGERAFSYEVPESEMLTVDRNNMFHVDKFPSHYQGFFVCQRYFFTQFYGFEGGGESCIANQCIDDSRTLTLLQ